MVDLNTLKCIKNARLVLLVFKKNLARKRKGAKG